MQQEKTMDRTMHRMQERTAGRTTVVPAVPGTPAAGHRMTAVQIKAVQAMATLAAAAPADLGVIHRMMAAVPADRTVAHQIVAAVPADLVAVHRTAAAAPGDRIAARRIVAAAPGEPGAMHPTVGAVLAGQGAATLAALQATVQAAHPTAAVVRTAAPGEQARTAQTAGAVN